MKMNWPFCFHLGTSFEGISCQRKTGKLKPICSHPAGRLSIHFFLLKNIPLTLKANYQLFLIGNGLKGFIGSCAVAWWRGGGGGSRSSSDNFLGALKFVIANVKYYTKYVKSSLSTN